MADYDNTNTGVLFKNLEKIEMNKPNWPDYKGSVNVGGTEFWLSAWIKDGKDGVKFMSLAVGDEKKKQGAQKQQTKTATDDDGIPF